MTSNVSAELIRDFEEELQQMINELREEISKRKKEQK